MNCINMSIKRFKPQEARIFDATVYPGNGLYEADTCFVFVHNGLIYTLPKDVLLGLSSMEAEREGTAMPGFVPESTLLKAIALGHNPELIKTLTACGVILS